MDWGRLGGFAFLCGACVALWLGWTTLDADADGREAMEMREGDGEVGCGGDRAVVLGVWW